MRMHGPSEGAEAIGRSLEIEFENTCARHRVVFAEIVTAAGVTDQRLLARIRGQFVVETIKTYPGSYIEFLGDRAMNRIKCMGCAFEKAGPDCYAWAVETVVRLARESSA